MNCIIKFFHRWLNCTRGVHWDTTHLDDRGVMQEHTIVTFVGIIQMGLNGQDATIETS